VTKRNRLSYAPAIVAGAFGVAALSQLRVQAFARQSVLDEGIKSNRFVVERAEKALRGSIFTADGRALAEAEEASELGLIFSRVPNSPGFFMDLGAASGIPAAEMMHLRDSGQAKAFWRERLTPAQTREVQKVRAEWRADGVSLGREGSRSYPLGEAAANLVGYLRDGEALTGLEKALDRHLRGADGKTIGMVDRGGDFLTLRKDPDSVPKRDGMDVRLAVDSELQLVAASAVRNAVESNNAEQGCAVVMDPATGDILAMASWPSFDPERIGEPGTRFRDLDPNYMALLEPGSTFKILTLALALDKGKVGMGDAVQCSGSLKVWSNRSIQCDRHGGTRAHGLVDSVQAISRSCNVSAALWAGKVGFEDFAAFLDASGLMSKPGLGMPSELAGKYNRGEYAKGLQLATFGFGQSLTVTPLALCSAFSMLGNNGVRMQPRLVTSVGGTANPVKAAGRLVSPETASQVMRAMEAVFSSTHGTGKSLRIPGYRLAGKTGTAEKINPATGTVEGGGYVSNFIGFVPAERPRAAILVMIDHPKSGRYYGATVAGPVFQAIAKAAIRRLQIPPSAEPELGAPARVRSEGGPKPAGSGPAIEISSRPAGARVNPVR
jgi:cell division protein FtsI/penicillin-binding protein 2